MYIKNSNQYAIELVTYLLVLVVYFYELIAYMLLERNAIDSIAFFLSVQWFNSLILLVFISQRLLAISSEFSSPNSCGFKL